MSGQGLRQTRVHRALHRPQQILGGERELTLFSLVVAAALVVPAMSIVATIIGTTLWLACLYGLRRMAKADPNMSKIYLRQIKYRNYYPPFSRPWRKARSKLVY